MTRYDQERLIRIIIDELIRGGATIPPDPTLESLIREVNRLREQGRAVDIPPDIPNAEGGGRDR